MKPFLSRLCRLSFCILGFLASGNAIAQVTPDGSGIDTHVNQNGNTAEISGGQTRGSNLFHSFQDFSVPTGNEASFNNADNISNIFGRVTGGNISNIDGAIRANGSANLFLINPAGIIFGENARLDIGGSFLASTSSSILFEDGQFSATDLTNPPLLTINAPIGLGFRDNPGEIVNRSIASSDNETVGLEVAPGRNLALIGGNVNFERGKVTVRGGNIELGGLSSSGTVGINPDSSLSFPNAVAKADISLNNAAEISVTGADGGDINVNARNLNLEAGEFGESSITRAVIANTTFAESQSGDITINVAEDVTIDNSSIINRVLPQASGNSGKIAIATNNLILTNGADVNASTFGQGNAGLVSINAKDSIIVDGENADGDYSGILSAVATPASGNSGGITITTGNLSLSNGGEVNASTAGEGNAGAININASDTITVDGERSDGKTSSILSAIASVASGNSEGINITTSNLVLTNGGTVNASTVGRGDAGLVNIIADNDIIIDRESSNQNASAVLSAVTPGASGDSEGINITTSNLALTNGGIISVSSFGAGNAGQLTVQANSLNLENNSSIRALIQSGLGGIINLQIAENITLKNNSQITARAFGEADGGNITIDTTFIIAFPNSNNDIIANAQQGDGGNITIDAQSLFGIEERPLNDESNDINAASIYSLDGNISVNTPDVNLVQEATELVDNIILPSEQTTAEVCSTRATTASNRFTIKGKGGIPPLPNLPLDSRNIIIDNDKTNSNSAISQPVATRQGKIQPAKGIKITKSGEIILTGYSTNNSGERIPQATNCRV